MELVMGGNLSHVCNLVVVVCLEARNATFFRAEVKIC